MPVRKYILPIIVFSQFCCTSLWFAGNAIITDLISNFNLEPSALAHLTSAVQVGFILGTFLFAILTISDRFSPSKVFFVCALLAAVLNIFMVLDFNLLTSLFAIRLGTGFFLAGIYPVGMKIASDYFEKGLGKSLGFLVGALVLGTAFPHVLHVFNGAIPWRTMVCITSLLSLIGGLLILLFVPDGPYKTQLQKFDVTLFYNVFKRKEFRTAAFGYFGHMWELYAFWVFVPVVLNAYIKFHKTINFDVSFFSFLIIGVGALSCVIAGYLSEKYTPKKVATVALAISCLCCLISPILFITEFKLLFLGFLILWGMAVISDSPLFSTLVAQNVASKSKGTAITIVNCIGFAITIVSIQILNTLQDLLQPQYLFLILAIGPLLALYKLIKK